MPIKTWDSSGNVLFDSDAVTHGVCLGSFVIPAGSAFSRSFSLLAGATVRADRASVYASDISISYPGSVPTVSVSAAGYERSFVLWATGTPTITSGAGMQAVSASGTVALSPSARGMNYIGKASHVSTTASWGDPEGSGGAGELGLMTFSVSSPTPPVMVVRLPVSGWVWLGPMYAAGGGEWRVPVRCIGSLATSSDSAWPALLTPEIYCFATPASPGSGAQAAVYDTDGTLAYDLLAGRLLTLAADPTMLSAGDTISVPSGMSSSQIGLENQPFAFQRFSVEYPDTPGFYRNFYRESFTGVWGSSIQHQLGLLSVESSSDVLSDGTSSVAVPIGAVDLTGLS